MTQRIRASRRLLALAAAGVLWAGAGTARAQVAAPETVKSFELAEGLEATVWAAEPLLVNPTNIDVDLRGRVWVAEGANYRGVQSRPEGDRIVILEDTDHDGTADSQKVFVQDPAIASPLGIAVLGNKVYVSQSPNVLVYTIDESGDKPAGKPEVWMTGFAGVNHDHGVHAIVFGPDGKLYFNAGNDGCSSKEPFKRGDGSPVVDVLGSSVPRGPQWRGQPRDPASIGYQQGMAFRCNPDGSGFEVIGHNFRNNFELAPDSFGTVWQSDNDDDGNESVRLNYVMEGGNFGFHGPKGHDWARDQSFFPGQSKQQAHWHQKWPGIVPNMINTGGGSPTGIVVYEGELLPEKFRGALIHCDPGPNTVRAYLPKRTEQVAAKKFTEPDAEQGRDVEGAGYKVEPIDLIKGKDSWFRPSDVCVAPDGSLLIADWYDPGVGGHQTADQPKDQPADWHKLRGRIYRVAPKGYKPAATAKVDVSNVDGQIAALKSPNLATRYFGYTALKDGGEPAQAALQKILASADVPARYRARALWLLAKMPNAAANLETAINDPNVDLRIAALRAARFAGLDVSKNAVRQIEKSDLPPAMLREVALAMNYQPADKAIPVLVKLANKFNGEDRWYLEALGIGATGKEPAFLAAWEKDGTNVQGKAGDMIRWRMKKEDPAPAALDDKVQVVPAWWVIGPFDGVNAEMIDAPLPPETTLTAIDPKAELKGLDGKPVKWTRVDTAPYEGALTGLRWTDFSAFAEKSGFRSERIIGYFATTVVSPVDQPAKLLLGSNDGCRVWLNGKQVLKTNPYRALKFPDDTVDVTLSRGPNVVVVKLLNVNAMGGLLVAFKGEQQKLTMSEGIPGAAAEAPTTSPAPATTTTAGPSTKDGKALPAIADLAKLAGDAKAGEAVFASTSGANCVACHQIGEKGQMLGPPLTTIGQKLSKAQLYEAILQPNAGILMGYENWVVRTKKGETLSGLKTSETAESLTIKDTAGKYHDIATADVAKQVKQKISIMPENLGQTMTQQELVDLVEYLSTLRNK